jgi:hypothetical protein
VDVSYFRASPFAHSVSGAVQKVEKFLLGREKLILNTQRSGNVEAVPRICEKIYDRIGWNFLFDFVWTGQHSVSVHEIRTFREISL